MTQVDIWLSQCRKLCNDCTMASLVIKNYYITPTEQFCKYRLFIQELKKQELKCVIERSKLTVRNSNLIITNCTVTSFWNIIRCTHQHWNDKQLAQWHYQLILEAFTEEILASAKTAAYKTLIGFQVNFKDPEFLWLNKSIFGDTMNSANAVSSVGQTVPQKSVNFKYVKSTKWCSENND